MTTGLADLLGLIADADFAASPKHILESILARALQITQFESAAIALVDPKEQSVLPSKSTSIRLVAKKGRSIWPEIKVGEVFPSRHPVIKAWKDGKIIKIHRPLKVIGEISRKTATRKIKSCQLYLRIKAPKSASALGILILSADSNELYKKLPPATIRLLAQYSAHAINIVGQKQIFRELAGGIVDARARTKFIGILESIKNAYGIDEGIIYRVDAEKQQLRCLAIQSHKAHEIDTTDFHYNISEKSFAGTVLARAKPIFQPFAQKSKLINRKGQTLFEIVGPIIGLPLKYENQVLGVLVLWSHKGTHPAKVDCEKLQPIADLATMYLSKGDASSPSDDALRILQNLLLYTQRSTSFPDAISLALHAIQAFGFDRVRHFRFDQKGQKFIRELAVSTGNPDDSTKTIEVSCKRNPYARDLVRTYLSSPLARVYDPKKSKYKTDPDYLRLGKEKETPWLVAPIAVQGKLFGQIVADNAMSGRPLPKGGVDFVGFAANLMALLQARVGGFDTFLLDEMDVAMFRKDRRGKFVTVNARFARDIGKEIDQIIGTSDSDHFPKDLALQYRKVDRDVMCGRKGPYFTSIEKNPYIVPAGYVHVFKAPWYDIDGKVIGVQGMYFSDTYRHFFDSTSDGIFQTTKNGKYRLANQALASLLGFTNVAELFENDPSIDTDIYFDPADRERFLELMSADGKITGREYRIRKRNGETVKVKENAWVVKSSQGEALYYEGTIEDLTPRIIASAEITKLEHETHGEVAAWEIAHELNNSFTTLVHVLDLLPKYEKGIMVDVDGKSIDLFQNAKLARDQINHILQSYFCPVEEAHWIRPDSLSNAITRAKRIALLELMENHVTLEIGEMSNSEIQFILPIPRFNFVQVLLNLLRNSIEAMVNADTVEKRIVISAKLFAPGVLASFPSGHIEIVVTDSGPGIPAHQKGDLHQRLKISEQTGELSATGYRRRGAGIPLCDKLLEPYGGLLVFDTYHSPGTRAVIRLPNGQNNAQNI